MSSPEHQPKLSNLRRSHRVCLSVPVTVIKPVEGKTPISEDTRTLIVSAHGALIVLQTQVEAGELLTLKHSKTQEELVCRVVNHGPDQGGKREVAVEFERPAPRFWRIAFPPADWNPRSPDAKPPTPQPAGGRPPQRKNAVRTPTDKQSARASAETPVKGA